MVGVVLALLREDDLSDLFILDLDVVERRKTDQLSVEGFVGEAKLCLEVHRVERLSFRQAGKDLVLGISDHVEFNISKKIDY